MDRLPLDILIDVLSRLPIKSLVRCRCVCKSWLNLTHDSRLVHLHLHRTSQHTTNNPSLLVDITTPSTDAVNFHGQMLLVESDETGNYTFVKFHVPSPRFVEFRVRGSCNGLLCLCNSMNRFIVYVCNPCNRHYIELPEPNRLLRWPRGVVGGFGFDRKSNQYKVVEIVYYGYGCEPADPLLQSEVHVYGLGDSTWRLIGNAPYLLFWQFDSKAFVNGALHWISSCPAELIVSFDIADEVFDVIPRPEFGLEEGSYSEFGLEEASYSLGMLRGCLSLTDSSFEDHVDIWVMNDYGVKESWTKYFTINFSQFGWGFSYIQILCFQRNGEVLLLHNNKALLSYSPRTMRLTKLSIAGLPCWIEAVTYVGTLISPSRLSE